MLSLLWLAEPISVLSALVQVVVALGAVSIIPWAIWRSL